MALIEQYIDSKTAVITLNNSEKGNVLNPKSLELLLSCLQESVDNQDVRVILLRSNGENFCLGMDLEFLMDLEENDPQSEQAVDLYIRCLKLIHTADKPVLCLVKGAVKAGGIGLMSACDIVIVSQDSTFELSEVLFGLIPANVLPYIFSLRLTLQKIRYLVITAKKVSAQEAKEINLIDEVHTSADLEKKTKQIIKSILRSSPKALSEIKRFTSIPNQDQMDRISTQAKEKILQMINDIDVRQAIRSFQQGDLPVWFEKYKPENPLVI